MDIKPPKNLKEVQNLRDKIAAVNRFVSKFTDKYLSFFRVLRKFHAWNEEEIRCSNNSRRTCPTPSPKLKDVEGSLIHVPVNHVRCGICHLNKRKVKGAEASLLYKPSLEGS